MDQSTSAAKTHETTPPEPASGVHEVAERHEQPADWPRADVFVRAPGWLPHYGDNNPDPCDIEDTVEDDFDGAARTLLLHLAEARAVLERYHGYWMNRNASYPGEAEVAALLSRGAFAMHNVTTHVELLRTYRNEERAEAKKPAPAQSRATVARQPVDERDMPDTPEQMAQLASSLAEDLNEIDVAILDGHGEGLKAANAALETIRGVVRGMRISVAGIRIDARKRAKLEGGAR